ncbi:MAG: metallophosphoesterase family protein [Acidobacteriota bacterium]
MRYLLITDLHSNLEALNAILAFVKRKPIDKVVCMGDIVGYGANPNQIVEILRGFKHKFVIRGNHDKVAAGVEDGEQFNRAALESALWTRKKLTTQNRQFLATLPRGPCAVDDAFLVAHGTPFDEDAYVFTDVDAYRSFAAMNGHDLCFFGHSHVACVFTLRNRSLLLYQPRGAVSKIRLLPGVKYLINPGSVGQPRDRDPKTGFAVYDSTKQAVTIYRIPYPVKKAQEKILKAGLPPTLAYRLAVGA